MKSQRLATCLSFLRAATYGAMNTLGIDYGEKRVGLAYGDELGVATPLPAATESKKVERIAHIKRILQRGAIKSCSTEFR